ncbi:MAG: glycosyltransferase [Desulfobacterales bacterium]|nr:glycosyltransferase [Desulfobacterales bacterium]
MHALIIPSWYPTKSNPLDGIFFKEQAHALKRSGIQVGIIFPRQISLLEGIDFFRKLENKVEIIIDNGIPTLTKYFKGFLPFIPFGHSSLFILSGLSLFEYYKKKYGRPDIIHAHSALFGGVLAYWIKKIYKIPYIITEHSTKYDLNQILQWQKILCRKVFKNADARVAVSPSLGKIIERKIGQDFIPWRYIPNMMNCNQYKNLHFEQNKKNDFIFLNIGLMTEKKGQKDLLKAFTDASHRDDDIFLRIGGDGPLKKDLIELSKKLNIAKKVQFLGILNRKRVFEEIAKSDIFILSSHSETFGIVLAEALSMGKPVISTDCGGPSCILNENNGMLVEPKNIKQIADAMLEMKNNISKFNPKKISKECVERFGETAVIDSITALYREIVNEC